MGVIRKIKGFYFGGWWIMALHGTSSRKSALR